MVYNSMNPKHGEETRETHIEAGLLTYATQGKVVAVRRINLKNILSFGPNGIGRQGDNGLELKALNIIIGPNGSGKSNFLEVLSLLQGAARGRFLLSLIQSKGGVRSWIWKGYVAEAPALEERKRIYKEQDPSNPHDRDSEKLTAEIDIVVDPAVLAQDRPGIGALCYQLHFSEGSDNAVKIEEKLFDYTPEPTDFETRYIAHIDGRPGYYENGQFNPFDNDLYGEQEVSIAAHHDSTKFKAVNAVFRILDRFRFHMDIEAGRFSAMRKLSPTSEEAMLRVDSTLDHDGANLVPLLRKLTSDVRHEEVKNKLYKYLKQFHKDSEEFEVNKVGLPPEFFQFLMWESNLATPTPITNLSEGTLHWLVLLTALLDPNPPSLLILEEPELYLHPDIIPILAELLKDAAQRTQIIVTTHSDILVEEFTDTPEDVLVCDKQRGATRLRRLSGPNLQKWLERYSLSEVWRDKLIGGRL